MFVWVGGGGERCLKKENTVFPPSFSVSKVFKAGQDGA